MADLPTRSGRYEAITGAPLSQMFKISLKKINDGTEKCEVYGSIFVKDNSGTLIIFDRKPDDFECVLVGGAFSLAYVEQPIFANFSFCVYFDLKDKDGNEFINNFFEVDVSSGSIMVDKVLAYDVIGCKGEVTVYLSVLRIAVPALISATLSVPSDNVIISGNLVARYGNEFDYGDKDVEKLCAFKLFSKELGESEQLNKVDHGDVDGDIVLPLVPVLVAVPAYSSVIIEVNLQCEYSYSTKEEIKGCEEFPVETHYVFKVHHFKGNFGELAVRVEFLGPYLSGPIDW